MQSFENANGMLIFIENQNKDFLLSLCTDLKGLCLEYCVPICPAYLKKIESVTRQKLQSLLLLWQFLCMRKDYADWTYTLLSSGVQNNGK